MEWLVLIGRILYSMIFVLFGLNHFFKLSDMAGYAASQGVPAPTVATIITGIMLVLGGLSVLLGYKARIGSLLLVIFLIPTAFIMHNFWSFNDPMMASNQMAHFMKNLALAGSALLIYYFGTGPKSLES